MNEDIKKYIDQSVLCWLATSAPDLTPNVSPKELFTHYKNEYIIIANVASPQTIKNIQKNPKVCISFIDIFIQKGYQIKGTATIIDKKHPDFEEMQQPLLKMTQGKFPFASITRISIEKTKPILAPSYIFFPDITNEENQIINAKKQYLQ